MVETASLDALPDATRAVVFDGDPRVVRLRLADGDGIPPHRHPDHTVVVHVLDGAVTLSLDGEPTVLRAGELGRFDGGREIAIDARSPSTVLVTLAAG